MKKALDIEFIPPGVSDGFAENLGIPFRFVTQDYARGLVLPRIEDAHKGTYGHALLVCGSKGMTGAAILATGAALRSGCGLVTTHLPDGEHIALAANYPSALLSLDPEAFFSQLPAGMTKYSSAGIGCGMGQRPESAAALELFIEACSEQVIRMVIDADAINMIAGKEGLMISLPAGTVLTPHMGELRRLVGEWRDEEHRIQLVMEFAARYKVVVVAKGPNTMICVGGKKLFFNSSGNSGMAKGGSGDVLTGFIAGLLARGYEPENAAVLGVYLHGLAGDKARDYFGAEGMNSADMIDFLADALADIQ